MIASNKDVVVGREDAENDNLCTIVKALPLQRGFKIPCFQTFPTSTYRACFYRSDDGQSLAMTGREDAGESDDALRAIAVATASMAKIIGSDWPSVPLDVFREKLVIGEWTE